MQSFLALFTSFFMMFGAFFTGLPHAIKSWDKPTQTITEPAKVLALYKDIAAKNGNTELRERMQASDLIYGRESPLYSLMENWARAGMFFINPQRKVIKGVPGSPGKLTVADLASAKAEYFNNGKTVVITLKLKDQLDSSGGSSSNRAVANGIGSISQQSFESLKIQVARLGYTMKNATVKYQNASIVVHADAASGKIAKANFAYNAVVTANRNETSVPFQQSFDYTVKRP